MKKTCMHLVVLFLCLFAFTANAADVLQPTNGNSTNVTVQPGDKFYDSGGPSGNYKNCALPPGQVDNEANCTNKITLCGSGVVGLKFASFVLFGGSDVVKIYSGVSAQGQPLALSSNGTLKAGTSVKSTSQDGCLTVVFLGTSIGDAAGWEADIDISTTTNRLPTNKNCNLVCNDHVNASMPADICERTFDHKDFINNATTDCAYEVILSYPFGTNANSPANRVDRTHLGYTFIYSVKSAEGNYCWGYVTIEDKAAPVITAKNRKISCFQLAVIEDELGAVKDNCQ
ncbi:MAG: hypothetical protein KA143_04600, partial [Saprospiraceae bacterium]|nr:hypothetical protein [Saprospiraceae bacterium]